MTVINPPGYLHNLSSHTAQVDRIAAIASGMVLDGAGLTWRAGVRGIDDLKVTAQTTPNMTVRSAAGLGFVKGTGSFAGLYVVPNDASFNVTITAANATLARNDLIILRVQDSFYTGTTDTATIEVVTGTASASPVDPAVPSGSTYILARVRVTAAATTITNAMIDDLRTWTAAVGGCIPCNSASRPASPQKSQLIYELDTGKLLLWDGAAWDTVYEPSVSGAPWTAYTPTVVSGTLGNGTITGAFEQIGKTVRFKIEFTFGSTSAITSTTRFGLPTDALHPATTPMSFPLGTALCYDTSVPARRFFITGQYTPATCQAYDPATGTSVNATTPFTWATGDVLILRGEYEAA